MKNAELEKANSLNDDIKHIEKVLNAHKKNKWIKAIFSKGLKVTYPHMCDEYSCYSVRFQNELAEWLEQKKKQYQEELDNL